MRVKISELRLCRRTWR